MVLHHDLCNSVAVFFLFFRISGSPSSPFTAADLCPMKTVFPLPVAISVLAGFFLLGLIFLRFLPETKGEDLPT